MVVEAVATLVHGGVEHNFEERTNDSYVLRLIAVPARPRLVRGAVKV